MFNSEYTVLNHTSDGLTNGDEATTTYVGTSWPAVEVVVVQDSVLPFLLNSKERNKDLSRRFFVVLLSQVVFTKVEETSGTLRVGFPFAQPILVLLTPVTNLAR